MGLTAIILAAGYGTRLHRDLEALPAAHPLAGLKGTPKPLLPVEHGRPLIDLWMDEFRFCRALRTSENARIDRVFLVSNHVHLPLYLQWAARQGLPAASVVDDGSTCNDDRLGAVACIALVLERKREEIGSDDVVIIAGDTLFAHDFQLSAYLETRPTDADNVVFYQLEDPAEVSRRGILEVDPHTGDVRSFLEKPGPAETASRLACPAFYVLRSASLPLVARFIDERRDRPLAERDAPGLLIAWLVGVTRVRATKISGRFDIGGLEDYQAAVASLGGVVRTRAGARVGLVGNPSDGFNGKTISYSLANYWAQARIWESPEIELLPHAVFDTARFADLADLATRTQITGYYGGLRLLRATCKRFYELARAAGLHISRNFTLCYNSNIPFAVGLAGSSAIVTATFRALMRFYDVSLEQLGLTPAKLPNEILAIEREELGITAGLQDRVIQTYEGVVYMDFSKELLDAQGHGLYEPLNADDLPTFYIAYQVKAGGESGKIHSDVRKRWEQGDPTIVEGMKVFARYTDEAKVALHARNYALLGSLMNQNFDQRRRLYSERVIGEANLRMIQLARDHGFASAFTGSGGAINCLYLGNGTVTPRKRGQGEDADGVDVQPGGALPAAAERRLREIFQTEGFQFERAHVRRAGGVEAVAEWTD